MPVAWVVTLGVCAGSAFAVRDVVFPSLSPSATPSLWQPKESDTTVTSAGITTSPDRIDVDRTKTTTVFVGVPGPTTESTAPQQASAGPTNAGNGTPARHSDDATTTTTGSSPSVSSPGTTAPGGGQHPGTTVPKPTTTTGPDTSSSVSQTTNPATSDTLPDDSGGGSSGPGRSGHTNDTLP